MARFLVGAEIMVQTYRSRDGARRIRRAALISVSALALAQFSTAARAQQAGSAGAGTKPLPSVTIDQNHARPRRARATPERQHPTRTAAQRAAKPPSPEKPVTSESRFDGPQNARTGTVGYYTNSTSVANKTNTPLVNIPQSVAVVTRQQIQDQALLGVTDVTRYVPGVAVHQGEGNRDELVIRGVDTSANFFVNGFRDDVQYFRDLYNAQSVEVLKGTNALTFGRGAGGGLLNRTLKEADGTRVYDASAQTGSFGDRRFTLDAGQAVNENVAVRLNAFYEGTDTFRDFGQLERYGINPTVTLQPNDDTKVKLSYEYFHDERTSDRGNPSQALPGGATRFNPTTPFAPNGDLSAFFGSPTYNVARANVQTTMAVIEHDFGDGLTVKNGTIYADYKKFYQNVYPANGPLSGAVAPDDSSVSLGAYQHWTNRDNLFNQTDFTWKTSTGPVLHTIGFGTELGRQTGVDIRNTGDFPTASGGLTNAFLANPFAPTYFGPVIFIHHPTATNPADGVTSADSNSKYQLFVDSAYVRDTLEITRWFQVIAGIRFDHFDMAATDMNTSTFRSRVDDLGSPEAAVIFKPKDTVSIYGAYSISYLPSTGDQFSALTPGTLILQPQKFENKEFGAKWNINPKLLLTTALYQLDRTNQPIPVPNAPTGSGLAIPNGATRVRGFETSLAGYVTDRWQSSLGYAYTDARIANDLTGSGVTPPIVAGNRVQLVPYNQFSWWNKYQVNEQFGAALGILYFGDSYATSDDTVRLPGFVRFDTAFYLKIDETWSGQLNIENLLNQGYWASADGDNNISPGASRTFRVSLRAHL
jgi:catecholate siderophore receptor